MKKNLRLLTTLFLALLLGVSSVGVSAQNQNSIIKDGDFELGGAQWNARNEGTISNTVSYGSGTYSGVVPSSAIKDNMANGYIGQVIPLDQNTDYLVSAYVKVDIEGADAIFTGRWFNNGNQGDVIKTNGSAVDQKVTSTEWKQVEYRFNSGTNTSALIQLVKWSEKEETKQSNAYIDNVTVIAEGVELPEEKVYEEIWRDDFDQEALNADDWGYELGNIRGTEHQHYVNDEENVFLRDQKLVLKATDRALEDQYTHPRDARRQVIYNSGSVRTHGKREFLYGKLEISAKLPKGQAVFPAFWTLGADFHLDGKINGDQGRGWPATGEIDIMELIGGKNDADTGNKQVYQTIHYGPAEDNVGRFSGNGTNYINPGDIFNNDFHTFAFDWDETTMNWYVDDVLVHTIPYAQEQMAKDIFSKPQYIQLNLAMGGAWPGFVGEDLAGTEYIIDYVSFSQTKEQQKAADRYYSDAPKIVNVQELYMNRGESINPLDGIEVTEGYTLDFTLEDSPMFQHVGGNVNVKQVVSGLAELDKISELPVGTYNLHYSLVPTGVDLTEDLGAKTARLSTQLVIRANTLPEDFAPKAYVGNLLSDQKLPEGWYWVDDTLSVIEGTSFEVYFKDRMLGEREFVEFEILVLDFSELDTLLDLAQAALGSNLYTDSSVNKLAKAIEDAKNSRLVAEDQFNIDQAANQLQIAIENLIEKEIEIPENPKDPVVPENPVEPEQPEDFIKPEDSKPNPEETLPATGLGSSSFNFMVSGIFILIGVLLKRVGRFKQQN